MVKHCVRHWDLKGNKTTNHKTTFVFHSLYFREKKQTTIKSILCMSGCMCCREKYSSEREVRIIRGGKDGYLEDAQKGISREAWSKKKKKKTVRTFGE